MGNKSDGESEGEMATCDVCSSKRKIYNSCCGVSVCFPCDFRHTGLCSVCDRDELDKPVDCDVCGTVGNQLAILYCPTCEGFFCSACLEVALSVLCQLSSPHPTSCQRQSADNQIDESPLAVCKKPSCVEAFWSNTGYWSDADLSSEVVG